MKKLARMLAVTLLIISAVLLPTQSAQAFFGWMMPWNWFGHSWGWDDWGYGGYPYYGYGGPWGYRPWGGYGYPYYGYGGYPALIAPPVVQQPTETPHSK